MTVKADVMKNIPFTDMNIYDETSITYLARVGFAQKCHKVPPRGCVVLN